MSRPATVSVEQLTQVRHAGDTQATRYWKAVKRAELCGHMRARTQDAAAGRYWATREARLNAEARRYFNA